MSTEYIVFKKEKMEVVITERSSKYDLDIDPSESDIVREGPQGMTPQEATDMAIGILYAVWCQHPELVNGVCISLESNDIAELWNEIVARRKV